MQIEPFPNNKDVDLYFWGSRLAEQINKSAGWSSIKEYPSLDHAVAILGATETVIIIDQLTVISANLTLPANIFIQPLNQSLLSITATKTLTINSPGHILAPPSQHIFTGSGTVAFTNKNGTVYPEWWGIDGTADEVQANLATATGVHVVEFGHGASTYTVAEEITASSNQTLKGIGYPTIYGPVITTAGRGLIHADGVDDVVIEGFIVDGNSTNNWGICMINGVNRITVRDNIVNDVKQYGIVLTDTGTNGQGDDIKILNNTITGIDIGATGLGIEIFPKFGADSYASNIEIAYNTIKDITSYGVGIKINSYKFANIHHNYVNSAAISGGIVGGNSRYSTIADNVVIGANNNGINVTGGPSAEGGQTGQDWNISNNVISGCNNGIICLQAMLGRLNITGNVIPSTNTTSIQLDTAATDSDPYGGVNIIGNNIEGNILIADTNTIGYRGVNITGNYIHTGYINVAANVDRPVVAHNYIRQSPSTSILIYSDQALVQGNYLIDGNTGNTASIAGILVSSADYPRIFDNYIENISGGDGNYDWGVRLLTVDGAYLKGNRVINMDTAPYRLDSATNIQGEQCMVHIDETAAGTDIELPLFRAPSNAFLIDAFLINGAAIAAANPNYSTFSIRDKGSDGTSDNVVSDIDTNSSGDNISLAAFDAVSMATTDSFDTTHQILALNDVVTFKKEDNAAGVATTQMTVALIYWTY